MRLLFDFQLQHSTKVFPIGIAAQGRERVYVGLQTPIAMVFEMGQLKTERADNCYTKAIAHLPIDPGSMYSSACAGRSLTITDPGKWPYPVRQSVEESQAIRTSASSL
jgi:hypothetical protein